MTGFDYERLRRAPDVEAPNLQAWDATDEMLVREALSRGIAGEEIAVVGDGYGAITLALAEAGLRGIRVHQDLVTGRLALERNARALGLADQDPDESDAARRVPSTPGAADAEVTGSGTAFTQHELGEGLLTGIRLVLLQLPKSLPELAEVADAVARWAAPDAVVLAGGRVKHMTLAQNEVLARHFAGVQPQRAERKSRLVVATGLQRPAGPPPFPVSAVHPELGLTLCAHGGAFAGDRIDIGTRVLLDVLLSGEGGDVASRSPAVRSRSDRGDHTVIDLGCGTGALAAAYATRHPDARVIATDRSAAAVRSARETLAANRLDRVEVTLDDAGSELPDAVADLILLNPPFHLGASVHEGAGRRLIEAAARLTRPGGEVWTVFNSHLDHRRILQREVGPTDQVVRTPKFIVTRSTRR
ncbi:MAG: methyltransferase [Microbacterium sp.]